MASVWAEDERSEQPIGTEQPARAGLSKSLTQVNEDDLENENEDEGTSVRNALPWILRDRFKGGIQTFGDAYLACELLLQQQLECAARDMPRPNEPVAGDAVARNTFQLLLTDEQQRSLFLSVFRHSSTWPRMRTLIGAPPYNFLQPDDAGALNASGFAKGRTNMVSENRVANSQQFGQGQLMDEHFREYRVAPAAAVRSDTPLPGLTYFEDMGGSVILHVKVRKHSRQKKLSLMRTAQRKQLFFPHPGETIMLSETPALLGVIGYRRSDKLQLRVRAVWPRAKGASTAAILLSI